MSIEVNADGARLQTDAKLHEMETNLGRIYRRAGAEMERKAASWFKRFEEADAKKRAAVDAGKITAAEYARWRKSKIIYSKRFLAFRDKTAEEISAVNQIALAYINGEMPEVYMMNINGMGTDIVDSVNDIVDAGISFDLLDADMVRILSAEDDTLLPRKDIDIPVDERWNVKAVQGEVLQGILQGENIPTIAKRLTNVADTNRKTAVRNARTMVTGAENRGRLDGMRRARDMGILLEREWMDAGDKRVRDLHAMLDGQIRPVDEPFDVEGYLIMYPGDPSAIPELVYNCRCTTRAVVSGFRNPVTGKVAKL